MVRPLLVFDLDGTLVDSAPDLLATLDVVLGMHGYATVDRDAARSGIGHGARHLIEYGLAQQGAAVDVLQLDRMHREFLAHYESHIADLTRPYPGVEDLLERFRTAGWHFAVCTNKTAALSNHVLAKLGLARHFSAVCGGDTFAVRKPHPGHLLGTISRAGGAAVASIMVGDSLPDIDAARNAGIPNIGVTFGYSPVPMVQIGPDLLIRSYDDLTPELAKHLLAPQSNTRDRQPELALAVS